MNLSLLVEICGLPLFAVIIGISGLLMVVASYLSMSARDPILLLAFLPITGLPLAAAVFATLVATLSSLSIQLDEDTQIAVDSAFVLQMHLVPLLLGALAVVPAAIITCCGLGGLAWKDVVIASPPPDQSSGDPDLIDPELWSEQEANHYLDQIIRTK